MLITQKGQFGEFTFYSALIPASKLKTVFAEYLNALKSADQLSTMERSQRIIDMGRIKQVRKYLKRKKRFFPSVVATFEGSAEPIFDENHAKLSFSLPPYALDGQHRVVSMVDEHDENNDYNDTLSVLFVKTSDINDQQQIFTDINDNAKKTTGSINILYNHESPVGGLVRKYTPIELLEQEKNTVVGSSNKLVTPGIMSEIFCELLGVSKKQLESTAFAAADNMLAPWKDYLEELFQVYTTIFSREKSKAAYRKQSIFAHAVTIMACIKVMKWAMNNGMPPKNFRNRILQAEQTGVLLKTNPLWEGRCLWSGKMRKNDEAILLTAVAIADELDVTPSDSSAKLLLASIQSDIGTVEPLV